MELDYYIVFAVVSGSLQSSSGGFGKMRKTDLGEAYLRQQTSSQPSAADIHQLRTNSRDGP